MASKPPKLKSAGVGGSGLTVLPFSDEDYRSVRIRELRQQKFGGGSSQSAIFMSEVKSVHKTDKAWEEATSWTPIDSTDFALDPDSTSFYEALNEDVIGPSSGTAQEATPLPSAQKRRSNKPRTELSKRPHVVWKHHYRSAYLDEVVRHSGRGDYGGHNDTACQDCLSGGVAPGDQIYRCASECFLQDLVCQECCVKRHQKMPFHRIEKWTGTHFIPVSLKSLGLRIQLNHRNMACSTPIPCHSSMTLIHTNGLHDISFDFCGCEMAVPNHVQLLRRRIYPVSQRVTQTCATFELLELLHKFALTTKAGTYDFYRALEMITGCTGISTLKSKYRPLLRMVVQFRHLKMCKWAGRAHDPTGPEGTKPGSLAVPCPHCPYPGINLAENWDQAPNDKKFLYSFFGSMDANFRLKNQLVSNYSQDPGLGIGMAYMLPRTRYEEYVLKRAKDGDISTCVGFQAIAQANSRFSKGLRYTGVGGVFCGQSEMVMPLGIGNLQKGERYANMDYIFGSAMSGLSGLKRAVISYDIACQWFTHLQKRIDQLWPEDLKLPKKLKLTPAIPKLHEPAHEGINHHQYSLNTICGVGLCDMECCERFWAAHNAIGNTTKTQGPGSRQDVLDDHFNWWNYAKVINMGTTLLRKYRAVIADRNIQVESHKALSGTLGRRVVSKWEKMCKIWEKDHYPKSAENPYTCTSTDVTSEAEVRNQLAKEEEDRLKLGGQSHHVTSAHAFIQMAHDIETTQFKIKQRVANIGTPTALKETGITEQRNQLRSRIRSWELLVPIYMPGLLQYKLDLLHSNPASLHPEHPENIELSLPWRLPPDVRASICIPGLPEIEERLRTSQCHDSLERLRNMLKLKSRLHYWKNKNVRGQKEGTRSRAVIDRAHQGALAAAEKYRYARAAKLALSGHGDWEEVLRELSKDDIRGYEEPKKIKAHGRRGTREDGVFEKAGEVSEMEIGMEKERELGDGTGETRKTLSWIWLMSRNAAVSDEDDHLLRVEWVKSRARAARATEEVELLQEEMRRTVRYFGWKRKWWIAQIGLRHDIDASLKEALTAVATKEAESKYALATKFQMMWQAPLGTFTPSDATVDTVETEELDALNKDPEEEDEELEEVLLSSDDQGDEDA